MIRELLDMRKFLIVALFELFLVTQVNNDYVSLYNKDVFRGHMCLLQVFASPRCDCPSSLFEMTCTEIKRQNLEDNFSGTTGATSSQNISTTTKSPDQHLQLVSQNIRPPKNCSIVPCTITSLTIEDSDLRGFDEHWLSRLGICPAALTVLAVSSF